jgi:trk system potassium uptake protein TrkA
MKAIIVGCGRLGSELAYRLFQAGHEVSIVDLDEKAFGKLPSDFQGKFNEGDALNRDVLRRAGIEKANSLAAVTNSDVLNAVVGHLGQSFYHVPNVVVRNYDPRYRAIHEAYNLQVVSAMSWGAQRIEEMMYHSDVRAVFSAGNGEVEVYEVSVPDTCNGFSLESLMATDVCLPVAVTRAGKAVLPDPKMVLRAGDVLHVSATMEGADLLRNRICSPKQEGR